MARLMQAMLLQDLTLTDLIRDDIILPRYTLIDVYPDPVKTHNLWTKPKHLAYIEINGQDEWFQVPQSMIVINPYTWGDQ